MPHTRACVHRQSSSASSSIVRERSRVGIMMMRVYLCVGVLWCVSERVGEW